MTVAGVRLSNGQMVWVETTRSDVTPLTSVTVRIGSVALEGKVVITPDQLVRSVIDCCDGEVLQARDELPDLPDCDSLPFVNLPHLGQRVVLDTCEGHVEALDIVGARVRVRLDDGGSVEMDATEVDRNGIVEDELSNPLG